MSVTKTVLTAVTGAALAFAASACSGAAGETSHHPAGASSGVSQEGLGSEHRATAAAQDSHEHQQPVGASKATTVYDHGPTPS